MDIMKLTRELGRALQQDQTYINMSVAEQQCNEDEALQNAIGEFNLKRMAINNEAAKEDRSEELIEQYNKELREIYGRVMQNEHMAAYQAAKNEFDALMQRVCFLCARRVRTRMAAIPMPAAAPAAVRPAAVAATKAEFCKVCT